VPVADSSGRARLTLYGRAWCHLCEDMRAELARLETEYDFDVLAVDVDDDPALLAKYDERVPVLCAGDRELCQFRFDEVKVREYLACFR
jgi:thiol-disulfide isomerase/thioredoxin